MSLTVGLINFTLLDLRRRKIIESPHVLHNNIFYIEKKPQPVFIMWAGNVSERDYPTRKEADKNLLEQEITASAHSFSFFPFDAPSSIDRWKVWRINLGSRETGKEGSKLIRRQRVKAKDQKYGIFRSEGDELRFSSYRSFQLKWRHTFFSISVYITYLFIGLFWSAILLDFLLFILQIQFLNQGEHQGLWRPLPLNPQ